ncbi:MAG: hypothetical protein D3910_05905 [Candidatus Electrothrix sp. ATG2]|nr:hypothetical protein [Candidatus Electrothrix sp. ATG2]
MKKHNKFFLLTTVLASCVLWTSSAFAELDVLPEPNVEGLSVEDATKKYGPESGYKQPMRFEVNAQTGNPDCRIIGPDCSTACPKTKIYYQSPHYYLNGDGSHTVRVDIVFDNNDVITSRAVPGTKCHYK